MAPSPPLPANNEIVTTIAGAGPFVAGNPEPVIAFPAHTLVYAEVVGQSHMRARLRAGDGAIINRDSRFVPQDKNLGSRLRRRAGNVCTQPAPCALTAGTAPSGCSCASSTWQPLTGASARINIAVPGFAEPALPRVARGWVVIAPPRRGFRGGTTSTRMGTTSQLKLSIAVGDYDRVRPLMDGTVQIGRR